MGTVVATDVGDDLPAARDRAPERRVGARVKHKTVAGIRTRRG